ncbi:MAG: response regulator, partial [Nitrospirota bacterium]|nr:response regulator [Nitrospirota bacterium]
ALLLVDDDPVNLEILGEHLEEAGYQTVTAECGEDAWKLLQQDPPPFQAVLLDRRMPRMNGMEVLANVKTCESLTTLPIIMQTAAASPEEIREGIEAGAFYYLTKPYTKEVLVAIVQAAVSDFTQGQSLKRELHEQSQIFRCLDSAHFHFHTVDEARTLALLLAHACPEPDRVAMGLLDVLVNAVEHGNLQISFDDKTRLQQDGEWETEIARRLQLPEFADKQATIRFHRSADAIEFIITDQGLGFDWKRYLDMSPDLAFASHGRGIAMARALSFDTLEYRGIGNEVVCTVKVPEDATNESENKNMESESQPMLR